jgi:xylose isomerase
MRTYLILKDKACRFREDREIQALLAEIRGEENGPSALYTRDAARRLKDQPFDREALAARPLPYERLDQLVVDLLLGTR